MRLALLLVASLGIIACADDPVVVDPPEPVEPYEPPPPFLVPMERDLVQFVDPMIGSQGSGNVIPGALVPHGMVRASPDTRTGPGSIDAYEYDDERIEGFTHLHLEGPGGSANGYNQIRFMPVAGAVDLADFSSALSHDDEIAEPGYYAITVDDGAVRVELTATAHAAVHRYTFPAGTASVVIDPFSSNGAEGDVHIEIVGDRAVRGRAHFTVHPALNIVLRDPENGTTGETDVYFHAEFSEPFASIGTWRGSTPPDFEAGVRMGEGRRVGALVGWDLAAEASIEARVGISLIDEEQAQANAVEEIGDKSFDVVRADASAAWNSALNRVQVLAPDDVATAFYTALYHSLFQPADYTESDGRYVVGTSGELRTRDGGGRPFYTDDWCMWDTFRTSHPLGTLVEPEIRSNIVRSMLTMYEEGGWLPKCTWNATGYSRVMTANNAIPIIVDAYLKGLADFDAELAWEAMYKASMEEVDGVPEGGCGYFGLGTSPEYVSGSFFGMECDPHQAASMTLEYAYTDYTMARFAEAVMRPEQAQFEARAQSYAHHWNAEIGFMQPKMRDGSWFEPFDPAATNDGNGFVEASSWIFSFFVPHDVPALIELFGGEAPFIERLDRFYDEDHFDPGNQPSFHIAWLYNYAGAPHLTQARVRQIVDDEFGIDPNGLPGNDDAGSMSSYLALAMLGIYPVAPGSLEYQLSTPMMEGTVLHLNPAHYDGGTFVIETEGYAPDAIYIQSVTLNGTPLDRTFITHDEITSGGTLHFVLGPEPSDWAARTP